MAACGGRPAEQHRTAISCFHPPSFRACRSGRASSPQPPPAPHAAARGTPVAPTLTRSSTLLHPTKRADALTTVLQGVVAYRVASTPTSTRLLSSFCKDPSVQEMPRVLCPHDAAVTGVTLCPEVSVQSRPGGNPVANLKSISHRCHPILVAFVWELTKETIDLHLGCLQGGSQGGQRPLPPGAVCDPDRRFM